MSISNDLIKQFVQITKDNSPVKHEATVYGTAVEYEGKTYVQIDGSELLTPVETSTEIANGERVTVMIKDHNATVTGNLTNPSAGSNTVANIQGNLNDIGTQITEFEVVIADKVSTKDFEANNAAINNLLVGKADIAELNAVRGNIENLQSEHATINELIATKADISDLNATNANIQNLEANKADINELNAITGNITDLNADIAKISTLIGGNASIDAVDSIILTADNVSIDNALIKNAMIDTIAADKITTGSINTNKVNIQSEDGGIVLAGSTQQFKDQNGKVRVQIGKDAQGNFTFCLFSQDGTGILLDETGIKAGAIADGLIVNDMVADNANISGSKLDISSVVTEINGNSSTIKSSVIKFDETGQSLTVAFNTLKEKVDTIEEVSINGDLSNVMEQVKSNTTKIEAVQGEISTLISDTTITKENGQVVQLKDDYSITKQTVDEISRKLGSIETNYSKTLKTSSVQYYLSTSLTSLSGGSWQDTAPEWTQGKYMWQRMKYTYTDNSVTYGTASCVAGAKGDTGEQGPQGPQGSKGDTGNSGVGVSKITNYYLAINSTTGVTNTMTGWTTTIQNVSKDKKYLWNYEKVDYTNNTSTKTDPCIIGTYGDTGATGKGIQLITEYYATSTTKESLPTSWSTTVPTLTATNKYLWNYEKITYTDNSNVDTPKVIIGVYGDKGDTGAQGPKGDKGDTGPQGVQGPAGKDGKAYYTWIKYADSSTGSGMSNDPTGKTYIGFAYNKTTSTESNTASDYTWSLIKGDKGDTGVQGPAGKNGTTTYTWIKYSDNADGTGLYDTPKSTTKYIGIATNKTTKTESTTKTDYTWSLFKGDKGDTGSQGPKGDKGDIGPQGVQGPAGKDGKTYYTWIKYADSSTGSGMSNDPTGKTYIGFAYNKTTSTESNTASDYTWSLIKGEKGDTGVQGPAGSNGKTTYTWIKYSDNADGTGLYDTPKSTTKYIGIATNKTTKTESTTKTDYTWSLFKGDTGPQGPQGSKGDTGSQGPKGDKGATGEKGQSLTSSTPQWYLSTSNTTQTGGSWQDTMPQVTAGKYIWQRFKNVWANPTATTYTTPVLEQIAESVKEVTDKQAEYKQTLDEVSNKLTQTTTTANEVKTQVSINKQTIDSMSTTLTSTTKTANEAKTQASTNKQTIDNISTTLTSTTNTANSALNKATEAQQNLDGFKTTVSNTYSTKTDFNNLTIGGRNFLINTKTPKTYTLDTSTSTNNYLTKDPYMTYNHNQLSSYGFKVGDKITVSYDWKVTNVTTYGSFLTELISYANSTSTYVGTFGNRKTVTSSETSGRIETTISLTEQMLTANMLRIRTDSAKWTFTMSNVKLEKGNKVTSWSPAPEDIDDKFTDYTTKADFNNLSIGGTNLFILSECTSSYITDTDGANKSSSTVHKSMTTLIPVGSNTHITYQLWNPNRLTNNGNTNRIACFNSNSAFIQALNLPKLNGTDYQTQTFAFPDNTAYIKLGAIMGTAENGFDESIKVKFEFGDKPTSLTAVDNKFANYSTTSEMHSAIDQKADSITSTVSKTYTTKTDFNNLSIGGRNLAQRTSSDYSSGYSSFSGVTNTCPAIGKVLLDGLAVGDTVTVRLVYKYENIVAATGQTASCWIQGSGDVTQWQSGRFPNSNKITISGSGEYIFNFNFTIIADHLRNSYWSVDLRHDYVQSGTVKWKMFKVEKGNKATDWSPAPEDIDNKFTKYSTTEQMNSAITQKANEITSSVSETYISKSNANNTYATKKALSDVKQTADSITSKVSSMKIGGGNLLQRTDFDNARGGNIDSLTGWIHWGDITVYPNWSPSNPTGQLKLYFTADGKSGGIYQDVYTSKIPKGTQLVISYDLSVQKNVDKTYMTIEYINSSNKKVAGQEFLDSSGNPKYGYQYHVVTTRTDIDYNRVRIVLNSHGNKSGSNGENVVITLKNLMLEKGNTPTSWQKSYYDNEKAISEVKQTAESITYKFENSSQANLLPHSGVSSKNTTGWYIEGNGAWYTGHDRYLGVSNNGTAEMYAWSPMVHLGVGGWYSLHGWIRSESNTKGADVFIIGSTDENNFNYDFTYHCCNVGTNSDWYHFHATFEVPSNIRALRIRVDNNGRVNGDSGDYVVVFFGEFMLVRGKENYPLYTDSVEGLYAGVTSIDKNGVHVKHNDGSSTNLNSKALNFYDTRNNLYSQVQDGRYYFWNGSQYIGYMGHTAWADTNDQERVIVLASEYGCSTSLSSRKTSTGKYQTWVATFGKDTQVNDTTFHQGCTLTSPHLSGVFKLYGTSAMTDTYPAQIYHAVDGQLTMFGDNKVALGVMNGSELRTGILITEDGNASNKNHIDFYGNLNMNGYTISNSGWSNPVNATSAQTYALRTMTDEESYSDPTVKTITDIFPSQTPTEGEVRWTDRETHFTSEVESGVYECYIEIPWWLAQNLENNYHVTISPTNGFYQYYVSERDPYYFTVRSNKDSMGFTFEIVGKLLDNNTTAKNASIASDQYGISPSEAPDIIPEFDITDIEPASPENEFDIIDTIPTDTESDA